MRELKSVTEFNSSLNLSQLKLSRMYYVSCAKQDCRDDPIAGIIKKFDEYSFSCGCGEVHSITKHKYPHPRMPTTLTDLTQTVTAIAAEHSRILFYCKNGFFTMVSLKKGLFKKEIKTDFSIKKEIIDAADNSWGLVIKTKNFILDFNCIGQRLVKFPSKKLLDWEQFEDELLKDARKLVTTGLYEQTLSGSSFSCPCGSKHEMVGQYDLTYTVSGNFCVPQLVKNGSDCLVRCGGGYYSMVSIRDNMPVLWYFKSTVISQDKRATSKLPDDIFSSLISLRHFLRDGSELQGT